MESCRWAVVLPPLETLPTASVQTCLNMERNNEFGNKYQEEKNKISSVKSKVSFLSALLLSDSSDVLPAWATVGRKLSLFFRRRMIEFLRCIPWAFTGWCFGHMDRRVLNYFWLWLHRSGFPCLGTEAVILHLIWTRPIEVCSRNISTTFRGWCVTQVW